MSDQGPDGNAVTAGSSILLPHLVIHDFLDSEMVEGLLEHARGRRQFFRATIVGIGEERRVDSVARISSATRDLGPFKEPLKRKLRALVPMLITRLKINTFEIGETELELVAHNDGAFYRQHIDTLTGDGKTRGLNRVLSGVYYFHSQPKRFSGGALRLHSVDFGEANRTFVDIEPVHNSFVAFPSFSPHEVMPVVCPSGEFMDSRFAINCWVHRAAPAP